jgi:hypothetical protein
MFLKQIAPQIDLDITNLKIDNWEKALVHKGSINLKGQCHEIFDPRFFSSNNPP